MTQRQAASQYPVVLPALCLRRDGTEFHAVTVDMSTVGLKLRSATLPVMDERLVCNIRGVGATEVRVAWVGACDFAVRITSRNPKPGEIARRLIKMSRQQAKSSEDVRIDRRIVPLKTAVQVTLVDSTGMSATILNLSVSGVALQLDAALAIGQEIVVGQRRATVARQIPQGIGAVFIEPLEDAFDEKTVL